MNWKPITNEGLRFVINLAAVIGLIWLAGKPHAETFIKETVSSQYLALQKSVQDIQTDQHEQKQINARNGVRLETLKEQSTETSRDVKEILRFLRSR